MTTPVGRKIFAIGDIHGCATELKMLLNKLPIAPEDLVVFIGDYIDRGSQSKEVIDTILEFSRSYQTVTLLGNHEAMLLEFLNDPESEAGAMFVLNGGSSTLASYGKADGTYDIPKEHIEFYRNLELYHVEPGYAFVHAGLPDKPIEEIDEEQDWHTLIWVRDRFLLGEYQWDRVVVHGHTPCEEVEITERRINIDTGCVYNNVLTAIQLPENEIFSVARQEDTREIFLRDEHSRRTAVRFPGLVPVYIHMGEQILEFETKDYNEQGISMRDIVVTDRFVFSVGDKVFGEIGSKTEQTIFFEGEVVRRMDKPDGMHYGLRIKILHQDGLENE